jgi:hypothetical protein
MLIYLSEDGFTQAVIYLDTAVRVSQVIRIVMAE